MLDMLQTIFRKKSIIPLVFTLAIIFGIFLNSIHHDTFIGYHPENIKNCVRDVASLPCSPAGWSFLLAVGVFIAFKFLRRYMDIQEATRFHPFLSFGANNINYLQLFNPLNRLLRRGIVCKIVYH